MNLSIAYKDYDGDQKLLEEMVRAALATVPSGRDLLRQWPGGGWAGGSIPGGRRRF
jgi:surface antigen